MEQAISVMEAESGHTVEIVVHITETLEGQQRLDFVGELENDDRITSITFCPTRCHLLLVKYDRNRYSSQDVLASIKSHNINARLVGPV
jgi:hypothetical protein